jgi:hypothetical protein
MATSGQYGGFTYRVNQLIEDAALEAGIPAPMLTADVLLRAMRALNLMFTSMPNLRIYTWQQKQILIPMYEGQVACLAPDGTFNLLDRLVRTPTRLEPTLTSSAGGTTANSDDDDFETTFTQVSTLGNLQAVFDSDTQVYEIGLLWGATATVTFVLEWSPDSGATWQQIGDEQSVDAVDRKWFWWAPDGVIPTTHYRVRMTSGTLVTRELYWGGAPSDITLAPLTRTQFMQMPTKSQPGRPTQAWLDRQQTNTYLQLSPPPSTTYRYCHVAAIQQKMLADVTSLRETLDVPLRWLDTVKANLAIRICRTFPEAKIERLKLLQEQLAETYMPAQSEDRDGASITVFPQIGGYT